MSLPVPTLRGDLTGTAFGVAPTWTDYTAYLEIGGDGSPIDLTWGRQDDRDDVPAGTMSFTLNNSTGIFTVGAAIIECDHRFNVRLTAGGVTTDRFTGYVTAVEPTWPGGVQSWSVVTVTCQDITGKLSSAQPLRSMAEQEMLADSPTYLYPLSEPSDSTTAGDITKNANPVASLVYLKGNPAEAAFGADMGLPDGLTGLSIAGVTNGAGSALQIAGRGRGDLPPTSGPWTFELSFRVDTAPATGEQYSLFVMGNSANAEVVFSTGTPSVVARIFGPGWPAPVGSLQVDIAGTDSPSLQTAAVLAGVNVCDGRLHHYIFSLAADGMTVEATLDGVAQDVFNSPAVISLSGIDFVDVGGWVLPNRGTNDGTNFNGSIALVAMYPTALSLSRKQQHASATLGTLTEASGVRYARIAAYGGVTTSGLPTGEATLGTQNIAGQTALDALAKVARTEGTVSYATGTGTLSFQTRSYRYNRTTALTLSGDTVNPDVGARKDMQDFFNELTVQRDGGADQRAVNTTSQAGKAGRVDGGSFTVASSTDDDALQNAMWQVNAHSPTTSRTRYPALKVDLLAWTSGYVDTYEVMYGGDPLVEVLAVGIGDPVALTGLPSQAPSASTRLFIEGGHEVIGVNEWTVEFFTSPEGAEASAWKVTAGADPLSLLNGTRLVAF